MARLSVLICWVFGISALLLLKLPNVHADPAFVIPGEYLIRRSAVGFSFRAIQPPKLIRLASKLRRAKRYHRRNNRCRKIMRADPSIIACSPNFRIRAADLDPFVFNCTQSNDCLWAVENTFDTDLDLPQAWEISEGSSDIIVAVLDTGIDLTHPDLIDNLWTNPFEIAANDVDDDGNGYVDDVHGASMIAGGLTDENGHGTHVAGIISAVRNNGIAIAGAAPRVQVISVKILDEDGNGSVADAINGIDYVTSLATQQGIPVFVLNNSWGGFIPASEVTELNAAFQRAEQAGLLAAVAAGNGGRDGRGDNLDLVDYFPAKLPLPNIIAVAATDINGRLAAFSNYGPSSVHLAAPGVDIRSLLASGVSFGREPQGQTVLASGTSMATPYVAAVLALLKSHFGDLNSAQIKDRLLDRGYPLTSNDASKIVSGRRVNAFYALTDGEIPVPTPEPTEIPLPTVTPSPEDTPTPLPTQSPNSEGTPTPPDVSNTPEVSQPWARLAPINKRSLDLVQFEVSAGSANLLEIELPSGEDFSSYQVRIFLGRCKVREFALTSRTYLGILRMRDSARTIKKLELQIIKMPALIVLSKLAQVRRTRRALKKKNCRLVRNGVSLLAG